MINESERNKRRVRRAAALQARATISWERVSSLPSSMNKVATRWTERKDVLKNVSIYFQITVCFINKCSRGTAWFSGPISGQGGLERLVI